MFRGFAGVLLLSACQPSASSPPPRPAPVAPTLPASAPTASAAPAASPEAPSPKLAFMKDDVPGAMQLAKQAGKAVFVDAWAPWCHTCLSMKHYVFVDPSLAPLAERMVFVAVDTDRPENEAFVEKYAIDVWPTLFVLDPESGDVIGYWPGAASVREVRDLASDALAAFDAKRATNPSFDPLIASLVEARAAQAERRYAQAAKLYEKLVKRASRDWPRRSEALQGWVFSLGEAGKLDECAKVGDAHLDEVEGAAIPADFSRSVLTCAENLKDAKRRRALEDRAIARLRAIVESPSPEASIDDRADALQILADALAAKKDAQGSRAAHERRLTLLEQAAVNAPSPHAASTYDYGRSVSYRALGRHEQAVRMLEEREKQLPDSYEPPARLASVLAEMGKNTDALAAIDRALKHAYGPRKLGYLALKARIQQALGDASGSVATLEEELAGWQTLGKRASPSRLADAKRRLDAARRATNR